MVDFLGHADQGQAHQRRRREVKSAPPIGFEVCVQLRILLGRG